MSLELLGLCLLIALVFWGAIRAPDASVEDRRAVDEEEQRLWYAADLRNRLDR